MKRVLKWLGAILALLITTILAAFVGTRGDYPVARLVTDDPSLPSVVDSDVQLHLQIVDGPTDAPTIVVLHGGPGGDFRSLQALDAPSNSYKVVFYDQRGAGSSERVPAKMLGLNAHLEKLGIHDATLQPHLER